jgi:hypothetical protein
MAKSSNNSPPIPNIELFGCQSSWIDCSLSECRCFGQSEDGMHCHCEYPDAWQDTADPKRWMHSRRKVSIEALSYCPKMRDVEQHKRDLANPFRRVWRGNDLVPIQNDELKWDEAHPYDLPPEKDVEEFEAIEEIRNVASEKKSISSWAALANELNRRGIPDENHWTAKSLQRFCVANHINLKYKKSETGKP